MTNALPAGVVVDTNVMSWLLDERPNPLAERYRVLIGQRSVVLSLPRQSRRRASAEGLQSFPDAYDLAGDVREAIRTLIADVVLPLGSPCHGT